jgi:glycogen operon protein
MIPVKTWLGYPYPLGATWMGNGVNFAIFPSMLRVLSFACSKNIEATEENVRIPVTEHTDQVWHVFLPDVRPGQVCGFRVSGPHDAERGCVLTVRSFFSTLRESDRRRSELGR